MSKKNPAALTPQQRRRQAEVLSELAAYSGKPLDAKYWQLNKEGLGFAAKTRRPNNLDSLADDSDSLATTLGLFSLDRNRLDCEAMAGAVHELYDRAHRLDKSHPVRPQNPMTLDDAKCAAERLARWARIAGREPLGEIAGIIYEHLIELPEHKAVTGRAIIDWLARKGHDVSESAFYKEILPTLEPWGVKNKPRIGYHVPLSARPEKSQLNSDTPSHNPT